MIMIRPSCRLSASDAQPPPRSNRDARASGLWRKAIRQQLFVEPPPSRKNSGALTSCVEDGD